MVDPAPTEIEDRIRDRLLNRHRPVLRSIVTAAEAVETHWAGESTEDRVAAVAALERELEHDGVLHLIPGVMYDLASTASLSLAAPPVAAPPYVTVTGVGVVIRLPSETQRLVITVHLFRIDRNPTRYRHFGAKLRDRLRVEMRETP